MNRTTDEAGSQHPTAEQIEFWNRQVSEPENEAPAAVGFSVVLGRSADTAVVLTGFRVFTTGVAFTLTVRLRQEPVNAYRHRVHELVSGHYSTAAVGSFDSVLLLGIEYADGRTATNVRSGWPDQVGDPASSRPVLREGGGGGGGRTYEQSFWLTPVPPAGPLTFVCRWPAFGIEETVTVGDATEIVAAQARVETLWPWEPENDDEPDDEPPAPDLPTDGWFATALATTSGVRTAPESSLG